jgi:hypothetical protein
MTLDDVREAKAALESEGQYPSYDAVLARVGHGSKRDVARFMQALGATTETADESTTSVAVLPAAPPITPDWTPAAAALARLVQARQQLRHAQGEVIRLEREAQAWALARAAERIRRQYARVPPAVRGQLAYPESEPTDLYTRYHGAYRAVEVAQSAIAPAQEALRVARAQAIGTAQRKWLRQKYPDLAEPIAAAEQLVEQVPDSQHARAVLGAHWDALLVHKAEAPTWADAGPQEG